MYKTNNYRYILNSKTYFNFLASNINFDSATSCSESSVEEQLSNWKIITNFINSMKRARKKQWTLRLSATLDKCKISKRDSVHLRYKTENRKNYTTNIRNKSS